MANKEKLQPKQEEKKSSEEKVLDKETEKIEPEKKEVKKPEIKKTTAIVNAYSLPISTKKSIDICKFIKGKRIGDAIRDLEEVVKLKKPVPMKGEIPHRRGNIGSGRFPQRTCKSFIVLLKSLAANASEMEDPIISEAIANMASKPFGRFGRTKKKRSHIKIVAKEINLKKKKK